MNKLKGRNKFSQWVSGTIAKGFCSWGKMGKISLLFIFLFFAFSFVTKVSAQNEPPEISDLELRTLLEEKLNSSGLITNENELLIFQFYRDTSGLITIDYKLTAQGQTDAFLEPDLAIAGFSDHWEIRIPNLDQELFNEWLMRLSEETLPNDLKPLYEYTYPNDLSVLAYANQYLPWQGGLSHTVTKWPASSSNTPKHASKESGAWDWYMPIGTEVWASSAGTVKFVYESATNPTAASFSYSDGWWCTPSGTQPNYVVVNNDDGSASLYLHLAYQGAVPAVGNRVNQGDLVGYSGNTGRVCTRLTPTDTTGAHLHFQVQQQSTSSWYTQSGEVAFNDSGWASTQKNPVSRNYRGGTGIGCDVFSYTGVVLFENGNCNKALAGRRKDFGQASGWLDIVSDFNDITSSIYVSPGWSAKVFQNSVSGGGGSWRCLSGSLWDLSVDYYTNGETGRSLNNDISSLQVYADSYCGSSMPPNLPANFRFSGSTQTAVTLAWEDVSNENGYKVYKWDGVLGQFVYFTTLGENVTSFTENSLICSSSSWYELTAYNAAGESSHAGWIKADTLPCDPLPAVPVNLRISGFTGNSVNLSWDDVGNETGYKIYKWDGILAQFIYHSTLGANTTIFTDSGLNCGSSYWYEISAYNSVGESAHTSWIKADTLLCGDTVESALALNVIPTTRSLSTLSFTALSSDPNLAQCNLLAGSASVWYKYTPTTNTTLNLDTFGSDYDTILGVFRGTPGNLTEVICNDDSGSLQSALTTSVLGGTTYYIVVSEFVNTITEVDHVTAKSASEMAAQSGGTLNLNLTTFADVRSDHKYWRYIEGFYSRGITVGCSQNPLSYCADNSVTRAAMAVFMLKTKNGNTYLPPASTGIFTDVPFLGKEWMQPYVEDWYNQGITVGCSQSPRMYCPENTITRAAISVFILKLKYGNNYVPPTSTGIFTDVPYSGKEWMQPYVEDAYKKGFTEACNASPLQFCPEAAVTRGDMAAFLSRAFAIVQKP